LHPTANRYTYVNEPLHVASCRDYIISSAALSSVAFNVLDLDINLSDHLPIMRVFSFGSTRCENDVINPSKVKPLSDAVSLFSLGSCTAVSILRADACSV